MAMMGKQLAPGAVGDDLVPPSACPECRAPAEWAKRALAVVVSAMTTARPSSSKADNVGQMATTTNAMAKVTAQVELHASPPYR